MRRRVAGGISPRLASLAKTENNYAGPCPVEEALVPEDTVHPVDAWCGSKKLHGTQAHSLFSSAYFVCSNARFTSFEVRSPRGTERAATGSRSMPVLEPEWAPPRL